MTQTGLQKSELDSGDRKESKLALRISAWTGVLAFPVFFVALMIIGSLRPGYSPISQHGSDLGVGWWGAWIFNTTLTVYGVILLVFVAGFSRQIVSKVPRKRSILVRVLLTLAAIGGVLAGLFSEAYPQIHALGGILIFGL
ncbi:MAG TPA: DUF998 domain-containing protein, partial [Candidatus Bathyarchaeia archaeon]|nr:DUF998 domain-containing protein [Candidatus Bathyarchaeia archaeon]